MVEPIKNLIGPELVRGAAAHLSRAWPRFERARFEQLASEGLAGLEMKARAMHIATALEATLPAEFARAASVIERSLAPARPDDDLASLRMSDAGLAGWIVWPLGEFAVRRGMDEPERALALLRELTQRFSAEYALRPFIARHRELAFRVLRTWLRDPSPHVRRLVSEGSRPRLPWGMRLDELVRDPSPSLPLLEALQDDPSAYVRRSVANHLNDIAKDHPELVAEWLERHLPDASAERRALLRHASRSLIKRGDKRVLGAWGLGRAFAGSVDLALAPKSARIGESVTLKLRVVSSARSAQRVAIDYAVHYVKANGKTSPKVFKGWVLALAAREARELIKRHSLRDLSTRRHHPGRHVVELNVNGRTVARAEFALRAR